MLRTMITATNTLSQLQSQMDVIGNNLSNTSTPGYKAKNVNFQELLYQQFNNDKKDAAPRQTPVGIRYGAGAALSQVQMNWKVGTLQPTDRGLDFAFTAPKQYFNILMPGEGGGQQTVYTRQGAFYVSPLENGQLMLVNGDGYPVADENGEAITFEEDASGYGLGDGGTLNVSYPDGTSEQIQLGVTVVERPQLMQHLSDTYMALPDNMADLGVAPEEVLTEMVGADRAAIGMQNGALEASNVDMTKEMADLINTQRSYQFNARAVTLADQMLGLINGIR